ncbi:MAG: acyl-protein synthetase [Leptothrix sp. (in: Bacteria)]|nr:acyl-protein synthetase [Leptothrix sp. (in: b-proteobacteria)]
MAHPPYALPQAEKRALLTRRTRALCRMHYASSEPYRHIVDRLFGGRTALDFEHLEDAPFIPVSLFKTRELRSVPREAVIKTLTSSGTTGQAVSRIHLDAATAQAQSAALVKIMQHFLGVSRRPMIFIDHAAVVRDRRTFSARGAGILGLLPFGRKPIYALRDDDMSLDLDAVLAYVAAAREQGVPPVLFGFTFMVWQFLVQALEQAGRRLALHGAILLHSGGWKKLEALRVSPEEFRRRVQAVTGIERVVNYYGMVEQVGSVYLENDKHCLHAPVYSDIIIRDPRTLQPLPPGQSGLIQVVSALPASYPGHSLLTEDLGVIEGCDDPELEMNGQYFRILGRLPKAELRGCSDTFQKPAPAGAA